MSEGKTEDKEPKPQRSQEPQQSKLPTEESQQSKLPTEKSQQSKLPTEKSQQSKLPTEESQQSKTPTEESQQSTTKEPEKSKLPTHLFPRITWANTRSEILLKLFVNNAKHVKIKFTDTSLTFSADSRGQKYEISLELFSQVVPEECSWRVRSFYIDITMLKVTKRERWFRLIKSTKRNNKIATDWDRLEEWDSDEDDEVVKEVDDDTDDTDDDTDDDQKETPKKEIENTSWYSKLLSPITKCQKKWCGKKKKKD